MEPDQAVQERESPPQTPGPILRRCREFNHITIEDAAGATKIGKNYLRALEEDRAAEFASPAYRKGFLRIYATHLGLNADDLLRMLEPEQPAGIPAEAVRTLQEAETARFTWQRMLLPSILLAIIIVVALFMRSNDQPPVRRPPQPVAVVQPPRSSAQHLPVAADTSATAPAAVVPSGVTLRIKALHKGNLVVTMDDVTTQSYDLNEGDLIEWKADRVINLELDDPSSVEMELNGKPYRPALPPGKPATLTLDAAGVHP